MEIVRLSIELNKLATPNLSIMNEIYKTFILSNPSNKACVSWSRIDNEQAGGMVTILVQKSFDKSKAMMLI